MRCECEHNFLLFRFFFKFLELSGTATTIKSYTSQHIFKNILCSYFFSTTNRKTLENTLNVGGAYTFVNIGVL